MILQVLPSMSYEMMLPKWIPANASLAFPASVAILPAFPVFMEATQYSSADMRADAGLYRWPPPWLEPCTALLPLASPHL